MKNIYPDGGLIEARIFYRLCVAQANPGAIYSRSEGDTGISQKPQVSYRPHALKNTHNNICEFTVEHGEKRVLGVIIEGIHHAAPVLVDLGRHPLVIVHAAAVARFYTVARIRSYLQGDRRRVDRAP